MDADPVASRIKALREERKLSQETLSDMAGLERWKLASIESGRRRVTSLEVVLFAEALETDTDELLGVSRPARMYRTKTLDSPAVQQGLARFENYVETSLRLRSLERFVGES
jgi:transcriptional regulator with XRE-family HTH domain